MPSVNVGVAAYKWGKYGIALREWRPLAEQGNAKAQYNLGVMYRNGHGVPQDDAEAMGWWRKAAEQGNAGAQHNLGVMYEKGRGVPQDYAKALQWYRKATEQGVADAQNALGFMYEHGLGVTQDYVQAYMWYNLAASSSLPAGRYTGLQNRNDRARVAKWMTPAQISEAQKLAREWKPKK